MGTEHEAALGGVVMQAAFLESFTEVLFCNVLGVPIDVGKRVTAGQPVSWVLDRMDLVAQVTRRDDVDELKLWIARAREALGARNRLVHSIWMGGEGAEIHRAVVQVRGTKWIGSGGTVNVTELAALADELLEVTSAAAALIRSPAFLPEEWRAVTARPGELPPVRRLWDDRKQQTDSGTENS